jgi:hypothetical protein
MLLEFIRKYEVDEYYLLGRQYQLKYRGEIKKLEKIVLGLGALGAGKS